MRTALRAAVLLVIALVGAASTHQGDIIYPIYELPTSDLPDLHDGTLEDWVEVLPFSSLDHNDFVYNANAEREVAPEDLAFRVFLVWHSASQRIYMAIESIDDVYLAPDTGPLGNGYAVLMIDGDHSGGQYWFFEEDGYSEEESKRLWQSQAQGYAAVPESIGGRLLRAPTFLTWTTEPPWGDAGGFQHGESPNLSAVELSITAWDDLNWEGPELSRRSVLEAGKIVGLNITVVDIDVANVPDGTYILAAPTVTAETAGGSFINDGFADNFVDAELIPCYRSDCSGATTDVAQDSWGRIKASSEWDGLEVPSPGPSGVLENR